MSKGSEILELLRQGWAKPAIMQELEVSDDLVRSVASKNRIGLGRRKDRIYPIGDRSDTDRNPIKMNHSDRAAMLLSAGLSPYEVRQLLPSWSGVYI